MALAGSAEFALYAESQDSVFSKILDELKESREKTSQLLKEAERERKRTETANKKQDQLIKQNNREYVALQKYIKELTDQGEDTSAALETLTKLNAKAELSEGNKQLRATALRSHADKSKSLKQFGFDTFKEDLMSSLAGGSFNIKGVAAGAFGKMIQEGKQRVGKSIAEKIKKRMVRGKSPEELSAENAESQLESAKETKKVYEELNKLKGNNLKLEKKKIESSEDHIHKQIQHQKDMAKERIRGHLKSRLTGIGKSTKTGFKSRLTSIGGKAKAKGLDSVKSALSGVKGVGGKLASLLKTPFAAAVLPFVAVAAAATVAYFVVKNAAEKTGKAWDAARKSQEKASVKEAELRKKTKKTEKSAVAAAEAMGVDVNQLTSDFLAGKVSQQEIMGKLKTNKEMKAFEDAVRARAKKMQTLTASNRDYLNKLYQEKGGGGLSREQFIAKEISESQFGKKEKQLDQLRALTRATGAEKERRKAEALDKAKREKAAKLSLAASLRETDKGRSAEEIATIKAKFSAQRSDSAIKRKVDSQFMDTLKNRRDRSDHWASGLSFAQIKEQLAHKERQRIDTALAEALKTNNQRQAELLERQAKAIESIANKKFEASFQYTVPNAVPVRPNVSMEADDAS